ncbi:hypothetical protein SDJN03_11162, partial [Cucurbita argyrosperma subsp. sororia]
MHTFLQQMWKGSNQQKITSSPWQTIYLSISSAVRMGEGYRLPEAWRLWFEEQRPKSIEEELENDPYDFIDTINSSTLRKRLFETIFLTWTYQWED